MTPLKTNSIIMSRFTLMQNKQKACSENLLRKQLREISGRSGLAFHQ